MNSIIDILRNGTSIERITPSDTCTIEESIGNPCQFNLEWKADRETRADIGDCIIVNGRSYYFFSSPEEEMISTSEYRYSAKLYTEDKMLDRTLCLFIDDIDSVRIKSQTEYSIIQTPYYILNLIVRNINRAVSAGWTVRIDRLKAKTRQIDMAVNSSTCMSVLDMLCRQADAEWRFEHTTKTLFLADKGTIEGEGSVRLSYPKNLLSPVKFTGNSPLTRMYVRGGSRNIPSGYADGQSDRLLMRGGVQYLEHPSAIPNEGYYTNDDIYPRRNSTVTAVSRTEKGFYFVTDSTLTFNINKMLIPGTTAKIAFNSGRLAGYEFEIASFDNAQKRIELKQQTEGAYVLPNDTMRPAVGDEYVLLDIIMPDEYVTEAEEELYEDAVRKFNDEYTEKLSSNLRPSNIALLKEGRTINLFDSVEVSYKGEWRKIRVTKVTHHPFQRSTYGHGTDIEVSDIEKESRLTLISNSVARVERKMDNSIREQAGRNETIEMERGELEKSCTWNF